MSCNHPMIRAETYETYTNKKGSKSYKAEFFGDTYLYDKDFGRWARRSGRYRKLELIGCGQCVGCWLDYSRDRATQMMCEKQWGYNGEQYPDGTCWFVTCTYDDEHLQTHRTVNTETGELFEGASLSKEDHQKFMYMIRAKYGSQVKYVVAGEYGSKSGRPHLHYIMFGLPLDQTQLTEKTLNGMNQPVWRCKELERMWWDAKNKMPKGRVVVGRVDWRSCAYVARYALKKAWKKDLNWYHAQGIIPEFIIWSNGIGREYFNKNKDKIYETDSIPLSTHLGTALKTPKSYDRILEKMDPELFEQIKAKRRKAAKNSELALRFQTDLTPAERRAMQEARMLQVMKDLRTEV